MKHDYYGRQYIWFNFIANTRPHDFYCLYMGFKEKTAGNSLLAYIFLKSFRMFVKSPRLHIVKSARRLTKEEL